MARQCKLILLCMLISGCILLSACGASKGMSNEDNTKHYSEIMSLINDGNFEEAEKQTNEIYGSVAYDGIGGYSRMDLLYRIYENRGDYDKACETIMAYIEANGYLEKLDNIAPEDELDFKTAMERINRMMDQLGEAAKSNVIDKLGQDVIDKYKETE